MDPAVQRLLLLVPWLLVAFSIPPVVTPSRALQSQLPNYEKEWMIVPPSVHVESLAGGPVEEPLIPLETSFEEGDSLQDGQSKQGGSMGSMEQNQNEDARPSSTLISASTFEPGTILKRPQKRSTGVESLGSLWIALVILSLVVGLAMGAVGGSFFLRLLKSK